MSTVTKQTLFALGLTVLFGTFAAHDADARGVKVRSYSGSSDSSPKSADAPAAASAPSAETAYTEPSRSKASAPDKEKRHSVYTMRAQQALEEERLGDSDPKPLVAKPAGAKDQMICVAGC